MLPRMYTDLARWWPLLSPPQDYVDEAAMIAGLLRSGLGDRSGPGGEVDGAPAASRTPATLLELGSGGGHNAVHLAAFFDLVLVDLSEQMLALSRRLNPDAMHLRGDMRAVRLDRTVDAVLVHDAIDYMLTENDLDAVFATARAHLGPGGVALFLPDHVRDTFTPRTDHGGTDGEDGSGIRYLEWTWDPNPTDTWAQTEYSYLMREPDGTIRTAAESHTFGLFPTVTWLDLLQRNGFEATSVVEQSEEDRPLRTLFVARVAV